MYRFDISGPVVFEGTLTQPPGDTVDGDNFGRTVDIDGDLAAVGSLFDKSGGPGAGSAYVYRRTGSTWGAAEELVSQAVDTENFGVQARVEDGIVAVSALLGGSNDAGTVQIFGFDEFDGWVTGPALEWEGGSAGTNAGAGLALGEDGVLAVGTAEDDNAGGVDAGAVQVFDVSIPLPGNKFTTAQDTDFAEFGADVDVDGQWAIVGATGAGASAEGSAYMFRKVAGEWQLFQELDDQFNPLGAGDDYGVAVAVGGDYAAIADQDDFIFVYQYDGAEWLPIGDISTLGVDVELDLDIDGVNNRLIVGESRTGAAGGTVSVYALSGTGATPNFTLQPLNTVGTLFGRSVSIDGDFAFASAQLEPGTSTVPNTGTVIVFGRSGNLWQPVQVIEPPVGTAQLFGSDLDVDGDRLIVGQSGGSRAWVFENVAGTWGNPVELASPGSQAGRSVSISGDLAVVGSPRATVDGLWAGSADVFARAGTTWVLTDNVSAPDREFGDVFASSLSIDGSDLFVGAPYDTNVDGVLAGAAYVYTIEQPDTPTLTFDMSLTSAPTVEVAPDGLAVTRFNASVIEDRVDGTRNVAAAPLSAVDLENTPLSAVPIGATPLSAVVLSSAPLSAVPLLDIDLEGGWDQLLEGTLLEDVPINFLTFGRALADPQVGASLAAVPLSAVKVDGTPLSAVPLSAVALGQIPLSAVPLSAVGLDWCDVVSPYLTVTCDDETDLTNLTLMEATLRGVPLSAVPLSAVPLSAVDFSDPEIKASPLSAVPLSAVNLDASPLSAVPLSAVPLSAVSLSAVPLSAVSPSAVPLSAVPLSAVGLDSTPLSAVGPVRYPAVGGGHQHSSE